jgi:hypothetical protein
MGYGGYGPTNRISKSQGVQMRGTDQQVGNNLLAKVPTYKLQSGLSSPFPGMEICRFGLQNRSGTDDIAAGIGFRLVNRVWRYFIDDDDVYTEDTVDAQDADTGDVALGVDGDNDTGFIIISKVPFNWVSINVSTAGTTNGTTSVVALSDAAGTGWTTIPAGTAWVDEFTLTSGTLPVGELLLAFPIPPFWGKTTGIPGLPNGYYALRFRATTQPAASGRATAIEIGTIAAAVENVDDNGTFGMEQCSFWEPMADAIVAFFSTAGAGNYVTAEWISRG